MPATDRYLKVANAPFERPVLIYDGECTFCQMSVLQLAAWTGPRVEYVASQTVHDRFPEVPPRNIDDAVQFVERDGTVSSSAAAVLRLIACVPITGALPLWLYRTVPGLAPLLEFLYTLVARNRRVVSKAVLWLVGSDLRPARYTIAGDLFPRLLGLVFLCAFLSLWTQWSALYGPKGLLPLQDFLQIVGENLPDEKYRVALTVFWWDASPGFVNAVFAAGTLAALLAMAGLLPWPALALCWSAYLSLCSVGQDFMNFQWDYLLLETGFLALFSTPLVLWLSRERSAEPSRLARWALWFLLFKLMFLSGVVKIGSGDPNWRGGTALEYHFFTQPLPTWTSWAMHLLPTAVLKVFCYATLFIELLVPFYIFLPRRVRRLAFALFALLQVLIALTGNYGFFNLLTLTLCVTLLDDNAFPRFIRKRYQLSDPPLQPPLEKAACEQGCALPGVRIPRIESVWTTRPFACRWPALMTGPVLLLILASSAALMLMQFRWISTGNAAASAFLELAQPLRSINSYGLFQVMTTERDEIVIEGSNDGHTWLAYEFKYKPGDPTRRPAFAGPHMPRLDWQMWFASQTSWRSHAWFPPLLKRLFEGSPEVLALLERNPFPDAPPRHLRARLERYTFAGLGSSTWWVREDRGIYFPEVQRRAPTMP